MLTATIKRVPALCLVFLAGSVHAERSMHYDAVLEDGLELSLTLVDADFDAPEHDGTLAFVGTLTAPGSDPVGVAFTTNLAFLTAGTEVDFSTTADGSAAVGFSSNQNAIVLSSAAEVPGGDHVTSADLTGKSSSGLTVLGDFDDLEQAAAGYHDLPSFELALSQSLAAVWWRLIPWAPTDYLTSRKQCWDAAIDACGEGCIESFSYVVRYNDDGTVIIQTSCGFTCESPCTD